MRSIQVDKVTLNIGTGEPGQRLDNAVKLLNAISGSKAVVTTSNKRIPTWKIRPGLQIGCRVTLRGKRAGELLQMLLQAVEHRIDPRKFDTQGNVSFGIKEYIDIPGVKYDAAIGVIGLNVAVTLKRPGFRVKLRKVRPRSIGSRHKITKEDAMAFMREKFNAKVGGED